MTTNSPPPPSFDPYALFDDLAPILAKHLGKKWLFELPTRKPRFKGFCVHVHLTNNACLNILYNVTPLEDGGEGDVLVVADIVYTKPEDT